MRVAIVTESFLPHMNGVTGAVLQILRHLERAGHETLVIAPADSALPDRVGSAPIESVPSLALSGYRRVRVGASSTHRVASSLERFDPDVVHLASPFVLGWRGVCAAQRLDLPTVAAYQTDVAAYASRYGVALTSGIAERHLGRLHRRATVTLVPSGGSEQQLARLGVDRMRRWGRGVDAELFHPERRVDRGLGRADGVVVGDVGRLAPEKQVEDLRALDGIPGVRLVIVGDGPSRRWLEAVLPHAEFRGHLSGEELATAMASFDVFVHPGESETFGQTLQEAHASGVPVVATGRGGPLDLVRMGIDGWLYRPGDLDDLRMRVMDLAGGGRKRQAFGAAGRTAVEARSGRAVCDQLLDHYAEAQELHAVDRALRAPRSRRPEPPATAARGQERIRCALDELRRREVGHEEGDIVRQRGGVRLGCPGCLRDVRREAQSGGREPRVQELLQTGFEERPDAGGEIGDLPLVDVHADDVVSDRGHGGCVDGPEVTASDH